MLKTCKCLNNYNVQCLITAQLLNQGFPHTQWVQEEFKWVQIMWVTSGDWEVGWALSKAVHLPKFNVKIHTLWQAKDNLFCSLYSILALIRGLSHLTELSKFSEWFCANPTFSTSGPQDTWGYKSAKPLLHQH